MITEYFFHNDKFYHELGDLIDDLDLEETINDEPEDFKLACTEAELEPIVTLSPQWIAERVDEERFGEDDDKNYTKIIKALQTIDFDKANSMMPKLYYEKRRKPFYITKEEIIDYLK